MCKKLKTTQNQHPIVHYHYLYTYLPTYATALNVILGSICLKFIPRPSLNYIDNNIPMI